MRKKLVIFLVLFVAVILMSVVVFRFYSSSLTTTTETQNQIIATSTASPRKPADGELLNTFLGPIQMSSVPGPNVYSTWDIAEPGFAKNSFLYVSVKNAIPLALRVIDQPNSSNYNVQGVFSWNGKLFEVDNLIISNKVGATKYPEISLEKSEANLQKLRNALDQYPVGYESAVLEFVVLTSPKSIQDCNVFGSLENGATGLTEIVKKCKKGTKVYFANANDLQREVDLIANKFAAQSVNSSVDPLMLFDSNLAKVELGIGVVRFKFTAK